jgi:hypothetical protein
METVANGKSNLERPARQIIPTPWRMASRITGPLYSIFCVSI